jgi:hypothetical protein
MSDILAYLRSFRHLTTASEGDGELLRRFRLHRDEQAFAILVQRHGSLVLGIIRRVLGQSELVDDTFKPPSWCWPGVERRWRSGLA